MQVCMCKVANNINEHACAVVNTWMQLLKFDPEIVDQKADNHLEWHYIIIHHFHDKVLIAILSCYFLLCYFSFMLAIKDLKTYIQTGGLQALLEL